MKLRNLTESESTEIVNIITDRILIMKELTQETFKVVDVQYAEYTSNWQYSFLRPFQFKAYDKEKFRSELMCGYIRTFVAPEYLDIPSFEYILHGSLFERKLVIEDENIGKLLFATIYNSNILNMRREDEEFLYLLLNYAVRPFELSENDLLRIRKLKESYNNVQQALKEYKCSTSI